MIYIQGAKREATLDERKTEDWRLCQLYREGDRKACNQLVLRHYPLVVKTAKRYQGRGLEMDDLIQHGCEAVQEAADRYKPGESAFSSYLVLWIRQKIIRAINETARMIRLPANVIQQRNLAYRALAKGRELNPKQRVIMADISASEIHRDLPQREGESLPSVIESISYDGEAPDAGLHESNTRDTVNEYLSVLGDDREREVIRMRYGIGSGERSTLAEVAEIMGLSRERIRQIESGAMSKMRVARRYLAKSS